MSRCNTMMGGDADFSWIRQIIHYCLNSKGSVSVSFEMVLKADVLVRTLRISRPNEIKPIQKELVYCV